MIKIKNITKSFGNIVAVNDLNYTICQNSINGFLGPNGSGKTTTVKLILGLLKPDKGEIRVNNFDVFKEPLKVKKMIGYKPDNPFLYEYLTAREFLMFIAKVKKIESPNKEIDYLLCKFDVLDRSDDFLGGFSFGMKNKIGLCAAFLGTPEIIILDEPTTGLDPVGVFRLKELLDEYNSKKSTILISSHMLDFVERTCHNYSIINKGTIVAEINIDELKNNNLTLEKFFMSSIS